jgi:FMN reductase (NADPH)/FMN reductase [NAD(P)H]
MAYAKRPRGGKELKMNETIHAMLNRRSTRLFRPDSVSDDERELILQATMRAPTAGNMMLYTILDISDQSIKDRLSVTCDNQPFIAKAPWVLLFLADYQRWVDYFHFSGVDEKNIREKKTGRMPEEGDLMLAVCDALIAAQTAVIAAESLGIGSCYIGDVMEQYETHREMFDLPRYVFPITMVCFGRPAKEDQEWKLQPRFPREYIVHTNRYRPLRKEEVQEFEKPLVDRYYPSGKFPPGMDNLAQRYYYQKFTAEFSLEMNRSVREVLRNWKK